MEQPTKNRKEQKGMKEYIKKMYLFYKENLDRKYKVLVVISILILLIGILSFITTDLDFSGYNIAFFTGIKEKIIIMFLIVLAGMVPYFYIPVFAYIGYLIQVILDVTAYGQANGYLKTFLIYIIPIILQIIIVSLLTAAGIYTCKQSTKKYRYAQRSTFGFLDVKIQLYEITKKEEKALEAKKQKEAKIEKTKKNDVKINYLQLLNIFVLSFILQLLSVGIVSIFN